MLKYISTKTDLFDLIFSKRYYTASGDKKKKKQLEINKNSLLITA